MHLSPLQKCLCWSTEYFSWRLWHVEMYLWSHHSKEFPDVFIHLQVYMNIEAGTQKLPTPPIVVSPGVSDPRRWAKRPMTWQNSQISMSLNKRRLTVHLYFLHYIFNCMFWIVFLLIFAEACCRFLYIWFSIWVEGISKDRLWCSGNSICRGICCYWCWSV